MGYGDDLMASGYVRGMASQGKRAAFGDGRKIVMQEHGRQIYRGNPNVAPEGSEGSPDLVWIDNYPWHRKGLDFNADKTRFVFDRRMAGAPGEIFLTDAERTRAEKLAPNDFILVEPNSQGSWKHVLHRVNKQWPYDRFQSLVDKLCCDGYQLAQLSYPRRTKGCRLQNVLEIDSPTFRDGLAIMQRAQLYIGPEGGLHHGAAALNVPAVVIFGGWISPEITGYPNHENISVGNESCGMLTVCKHCIDAMASITVDRVYDAARRQLDRNNGLR
jgi:hypothetical protein